MTTDLDAKDFGLIIDDGISHLAIEPIGPVELGFPVRFSITSGPFAAVVESEALDFAAFHEALVSLHRDLAGEAALHFLGEEHTIVFSGIGFGRIAVQINVTDGRRPWAASLIVKMLLDQSYLPDIIHSIGRVFLKS